LLSGGEFLTDEDLLVLKVAARLTDAPAASPPAGGPPTNALERVRTVRDRLVAAAVRECWAAPSGREVLAVFESTAYLVDDVEGVAEFLALHPTSECLVLPVGSWAVAVRASARTWTGDVPDLGDRRGSQRDAHPRPARRPARPRPATEPVPASVAVSDALAAVTGAKTAPDQRNPSPRIRDAAGSAPLTDPFTVTVAPSPGTVRPTDEPTLF
jgi:hypothetical protein